MSSPFIPPSDGYMDRRVASSPAPTEMGEPQDDSFRPMKLKVLYTFDDQNKTNCLARWNSILNIRTASLDENTQIGVVELRTCIQAIVTASPELVTKLGQDYTVYAYDYSEYETPLVGQGMLSWVLASSSPTPSASAQQSQTLVTGRVCKNLLGLFSNGIQETLEVKLRLVPVPTSLQSEYVESMSRYRDISQIASEGFDTQAWAELVRANPNILSMTRPTHSRSNSPTTSIAQGNMGMEQVQRLIEAGTLPQHSRNQSFHERRGSYASSIGGFDQQTRMGSPTPSIQSTILQPAPTFSRSASRTSNHLFPTQEPKSMRGQADDGYASNDDRAEESQARKRAKIVKAEYPGKSSFGKQVDSLRVAASTAASVRVFQPSAVRQSAVSPNSLEEPPRAPTPIPRSHSFSRRPNLTSKSSNLSRSMSNGHFDYPMLQHPQPGLGPRHLESAATSPEGDWNGSIAFSPADEPASSPPVFRDQSIAPSSPVLPTIPLHEDSGFMSGNLEELFGDGELDGDREAQIGNKQMLRHSDMPSQLPNSHVSSSGHPMLLQASRSATAPRQTPSRMPTPPHTFAQPRSRPQTPSHTILESNLPAKTNDQTEMNLPLQSQICGQPITSGNLKRKTSEEQAAEAKAIELSRRNARRAIGFKRSQTWAGNVESSDPVVPGSEVQLPPPRRGSDAQRSGSGAPRTSKPRAGWNKDKRKAAIQSKLAASIASGEMPPFCENCGAIETPTWRKAFSQIRPGSSEGIDLSKTGEGAVVALQVIERDEDGAVTLFRVFKKSLLKTDEGYADVLLCNPCGLWLAQKRSMRPEQQWNVERKKRDEGNPPKAKAARQKKKKALEIVDGISMTSSSAIPPSEMGMTSEMMLPSDATWAPAVPTDGVAETSPDDGTGPELTPMSDPTVEATQDNVRTQNTSRETLDPGALAALQHAIQASPGRFLGSKMSPIKIDEQSPEPARRTLFRSPKTAGPLGINIKDNATCQKPQKALNEGNFHPTSPTVDQADKENMPPQPTSPDPFTDLFADFGSPATPSRNNNSNSSKKVSYDLLKTPTPPTPRNHLTTGEFFSSAARAFLSAPMDSPQQTPTQPLKKKPRLASKSEDFDPFTTKTCSALDLADKREAAWDRQRRQGDLPYPRNALHYNQDTDRWNHKDWTGKFVNTTPKKRSSPKSKSPPNNNAVPSSDPAGWFGVYEDPTEPDWSDIGFGSSPPKNEKTPERKVDEADSGKVKKEEQVAQFQRMLTSWDMTAPHDFGAFYD